MLKNKPTPKQLSWNLQQKADSLMRKFRLKKMTKGQRKILKIKKKQLKVRKRIPTKYKDYIKSKYWKIRKNEYWQKHEKICMACTSKKRIILHHMKYGQYGYEPDENLVSLCNDCHEEFHANNELKKDMKESTSAFIISKREQVEFPKLR